MLLHGPECPRTKVQSALGHPLLLRMQVKGAAATLPFELHNAQNWFFLALTIVYHIVGIFDLRTHHTPTVHKSTIPGWAGGTHKAGLPFGCACGKQAGTDSDVAQKLPRLPPYTHYILPSRYTTWGSVPLTPPGVVPRRHPCRAYRPPLSEGSFGANLPYHFIVRIPFASRFLLGLETLCCYRNNGNSSPHNSLSHSRDF